MTHGDRCMMRAQHMPGHHTVGAHTPSGQGRAALTALLMVLTLLLSPGRVTAAPPPPTFTAQTPFTVGPAPGEVAIADLNGDGKLDLIVTNQGPNISTTISVLMNTTPTGATTPTFAAQQMVTVGNAPFGVAVADFNGDGKPDLVISNIRDGTVSVLLNTTPTGAAAPTFATQAVFPVGANPDVVVVADFNGDGKPDLVVANQNDNTVSVLLNTTATGATTPTFTAQTTFPVGTGPIVVAVGDFNGDGKPDLVVTNIGSNTVSVLLNTTATGATVPTFTAQATFPVGSGPAGVAVGDINGDGKPDLAVTNFGSGNTVSVLLNTTPPFLPVTLAPATLPPATVGTAFAQTFTASGGAGGPYTIALASGSTLPPGLTLTGNTLAGTPTAAGSYTFTLTVTDNLNNTGNQTYTLTVNKATTTTSVTANPTTSMVGGSVTLTATVTGSGGTPTGTVTFTSGTTTLGTGTLNGMGVATTNTTALPVGVNQTITATYSGDANFAGSTGTTTATVNPAMITVTAPTGSGSGNTGSATMPIMRIGAMLPLTAQIGGNVVTGVTYTSSDPTTVTVNPTTGVVTALRAGTVTITVTGPNGATGTISITALPAAGSGLVPAPQPMTHADAPAAPAATPVAQPAAHPAGTGTGSGGGGVQPQAAGMPTATPAPQPARH